MKKLIGMIMAIAMTFALATTAFAADPITENGTKVFVTTTPTEGETQFDKVNGNTIEIGIPANFEAGANDPYKVEANYYVIVKYNVESNLVFTVGETAYTWNVNVGETSKEAKHTLKGEYTGDWSGTATVNVTVENWSNRDMQAALSFTGATPNENNNVLSNITVNPSALSYTNTTDATYAAKTKFESNALKLQSAAFGVGFGATDKANSPVEGKVQFMINANASVGEGQKAMTGNIKNAQATIGTLTVKLTALQGNNFATSSQP